jgi:hypothetical protein
MKSREILIFFGRTGEGLKSSRFSFPRGRITGMGFIAFGTFDQGLIYGLYLNKKDIQLFFFERLM